MPQPWFYQPPRFRKTLAICLLLLLVAGALGACGVPVEQERPGLARRVEATTLAPREEQPVVVSYYATEDRRYLVPVGAPIAGGDPVQVSAERVLAGPSLPGLVSAFPEGVKLRRIRLEGTTAWVDLAVAPDAFSEPAMVSMALRAMVLTLTEFPQVERVGFVNGNLYPAANQQPESGLFERPTYVNWISGEGSPGEDQFLATVYFGAGNGVLLVPLSFPIKDPDAAAEVALRRLLTGPPQGSGLEATVRPGTKLSGLTIEDGTAEVHLSGQALEYDGGVEAEQLFINSLVWTLTGVPGVEAVRLSIDGKPQELLPRHDGSEPPLPGPRYLNLVGAG